MRARKLNVNLVRLLMKRMRTNSETEGSKRQRTEESVDQGKSEGVAAKDAKTLSAAIHRFYLAGGGCRLEANIYSKRFDRNDDDRGPGPCF